MPISKAAVASVAAALVAVVAIAVINAQQRKEEARVAEASRTAELERQNRERVMNELREEREKVELTAKWLVTATDAQLMKSVLACRQSVKPASECGNSWIADYSAQTLRTLQHASAALGKPIGGLSGGLREPEGASEGNLQRLKRLAAALKTDKSLAQLAFEIEFVQECSIETLSGPSRLARVATCAIAGSDISATKYGEWVRTAR